MILNQTATSRRAGIAVASGTALAAWAFFALSGASAARLPDEPPKSEVQVTVEATDGEPAEVLLFVADGDAAAGGAGQQNVHFWTEAHGGGADHMMFVSAREMDAGALAAFLAERPAADVDGDGLLTMEEHDAYVTALVLTAPAAVIEQFPRADLNSDGLLGALEAARLVTGAIKPQLKIAMRHGDTGEVMDVLVNPLGNLMKRHRVATAHASAAGGAVVTQSVTSGEGDKSVDVNVTDGQAHIRIRHADGTVEERTVPVPAEGDVWTTDDADGGARVMIRKADGGAGEGVERIVTRVAPGAQAKAINMPIDPLAPSRWVLANVANEPAAADVALSLPAVRQAPLALFLELNPEADTNRDGTLTPEERDRFVDAHMTAMRTRVLEKHPDADTNGDGILTNDEMHAFFRALRPEGGRKMIIERINDGEGEVREVIEIENDEEGPI